MDFQTAMELLRALMTLSGTVSAYLITRRNKEKELQSNFTEKEQLNSSEAQFILSEGRIAEKEIEQIDIKFFQALPKDIGDACKNKIAKILKRYSDAINSPISVFELDKESEIAEFEICHTLKLIMKHNRGMLPTKNLRDLWERFNCDKKDH